MRIGAAFLLLLLVAAVVVVAAAAAGPMPDSPWTACFVVPDDESVWSASGIPVVVAPTSVEAAAAAAPGCPHSRICADGVGGVRGNHTLIVETGWWRRKLRMDGDWAQQLMPCPSLAQLAGWPQATLLQDDDDHDEPDLSAKRRRRRRRRQAVAPAVCGCHMLLVPPPPPARSSALHANVTLVSDSQSASFAAGFEAHLASGIPDQLDVHFQKLEAASGANVTFVARFYSTGEFACVQDGVQFTGTLPVKFADFCHDYGFDVSTAFLDDVWAAPMPTCVCDGPSFSIEFRALWTEGDSRLLEFAWQDCNGEFSMFPSAFWPKFSDWLLQNIPCGAASAVGPSARVLALALLLLLLLLGSLH